MVFNARPSVIRVMIAWTLVLLIVVPLPAQRDQLPRHIPDQPVQPPPPIRSPLEKLIQKYTSTVDLSFGEPSIGKIRMIWLHDELLKAVVDEFASQNVLPPTEIVKLRQRLSIMLQTSKSIPFLVIFQPATNALIGRPEWMTSPNHMKQYPSLLLRGTGSQMEGPYKWSQILGEGTHTFFESVTTGYAIYKARRPDGRKLVQSDDFSFSVEYKGLAVSKDTEYSIEAEFHYDLMPVPIQSIIDASIPSWNPGIVRVIPAEVARGEGQNTRQVQAFTSQASATTLTRSEIIGIVGLVIAFAQFIAAAGVLL